MILVTGATGLTGHFVVQELQQRNDAVRVLVREGSQAKAPPNTEIVLGDLTDLVSLQRAMEGVTGIVHSACTFTDSRIDITAMETLLDHWQAGPFIFISSLDVYGFAKTVPITEDHPLDESYGDYAHGKIVCERLLMEKAQALGRSDYAILRAPYIWGPHPTAYARLVKAAIRNGESIVLPGADKAEWSDYQDVWTDVRDLAWVVAECLLRPPGVALNVLSGHFSWHELYATLIDLSGSSSQLIHKPLDAISESELPRKEIYAQRWRFSNKRLRTMLGFVPKFSLRETLQAVVKQKPADLA
ncbi:MAG: NAD(P)-dependent oxidoreductase [Caldilineaceae bacterium]